MTPVANFQITPSYLSVKFLDLSTNTPTSWLWDFGDVSTSTSQNPTHVYAASGKYIVKLTSTNTDGSSVLQREIIVSTTPILPIPLKSFVNLKLPSGITVSEEAKDAYIAQWQLFLQPLVIPSISDVNVFNETAYPPLANALIAMLAAYSIMSDNAYTSGISSASSGTGGSSGVVKKIVTGPSEVEFQETKDLQKILYGEQGLLKQLESELCTLASRLLVKLPMCPNLPDVKFIDLKAGRNNLPHLFRATNYGSLTNDPASAWCSYPTYLQLTC